MGGRGALEGAELGFGCELGLRMVGIEILMTGAAGGRGGVTGMLGMGILRGSPAIGDGLVGLGAAGRPCGIVAGRSGMYIPCVLGAPRSMSCSVGRAGRIGGPAAG